MPKVTYVEFGGKEHLVELPVGANLMDGAIDNGVEGIIGECGGNCACCTCHVYVDPAWFDKTGEVEELEQVMLSGAIDGRETSRLACQITMSDSLDGIVISLPERQY